MTQKEIAGTLGVSTATVSLALNDSPVIKKTTREKIKNLAKLTGYRPNLTARGLLSGKTLTIGIILPSFSEPFYAELGETIHFYLKKNGYVGIFFPAPTIKEYKEATEVLLSRKVDGIISRPTNAEEVVKLKQEPIPVVYYDMPGLAVNCVNVDRHAGGYLATSHLIGLGHKNIGFIGLAEKNEERFTGYQSALRQHNLPLKNDWLIPGWGFRETGYTGMKKILSLKNRPTAIFALCDLAAFGAMRAIVEAGLKVPEDFAVIGFDNVEEARYSDVALTTIGQPMGKIAEKLVKIVLEKIENKNTGSLQQITIKPKLIIRESCGYSLTKKNRGRG